MKRRANAGDFLTGHCKTSATLPIFDCIICSDTAYAQLPVPINAHQACGGCFDRVGGYRDQFEAHLLNEIHQPKFGNAVINFQALQHLFPATFTAVYYVKLSEYAIPAAQRVYCAKKSCSVYLGTRNSHLVPTPCSECGDRTCEFYSGGIAGSLTDHICEKAEEADRDFDGLEKGVEYQKCPKCPAKLELSETCNHMKGPCGGQFCFICGQSAEEDDEHWMRSLGCPRYGAKGSPNAIFDDDPENMAEEHEGFAHRHIEGFIQQRRDEGLGDNLYKDLYEDLPTPTAPERDILIRARRTYRERLYDILLDLGDRHETNNNDGMDSNRSKAMLHPVYHVAMIALVSLDYFTAHLEHDQRGRDAHYRYARHLRPNRDEFDRNLPRITSGQFEQFSGLATIITAHQLAEGGRIDELRNYLYTQRCMRLL